MSQLVDITITNRGANLDLLPGGPTLYGFDVKDIVSPIRYSSGLSKSYFTARTNKGGVNDNHNGSKIDYQSSNSLAVIAAKSPLFLLLNVVSRRGVDGGGEAYIFVSSKITENLVPTPDGTLFYYIEDGDPLPVEYIVEQTVPEIIAISGTGFLKIQDNGVDMPPEQKLNFVGYTVEDNPVNSSTDIIAVKPIEYSDLLTLKNAGDLPLGAQYLITDKGDAGIIATVGAPNKIALEAKGLFLVPDFQDVGTYTKTPLAKGTNQKVWSLAEQSGAPYADGDIVFLDGIMYQVIDDTLFDTNSPDLNASAYEALTKNVNNGYILETDKIIYNFTNDLIVKRQDKRGNNIDGYAQSDFQWGNDLCSGNVTHGYNSIIVCVNSKGVVKDNIILNGDINLSNSHLGNLINNRFTSPLGVTCSLNLGVTVGFSIFDNIPSSTLDPTVSYEFKIANLNSSDFEAELDMSDPSIFSGGVLNLPLDASLSSMSHVGIFVLNNNSGQTINKISGWGTSTSDRNKVIFKCADGITQSFQHTSITTAILNQLCADAVSTNVIEGRADGGDFIEYERSGIINVRTNIVKLT